MGWKSESRSGWQLASSNLTSWDDQDCIPSPAAQNILDGGSSHADCTCICIEVRVRVGWVGSIRFGSRLGLELGLGLGLGHPNRVRISVAFTLRITVSSAVRARSEKHRIRVGGPGYG